MKQQDILGKYKLVLGLEIHLHIKSKHKMFCRCLSDIYNAKPNTHTCPVCMGMPGALPVPNLTAVKSTQILGLALKCQLNQNSLFDRKHYFYPDLPKGYQISQYKNPLCLRGYLDLENGFRVLLERIHLEEDTAKSFHEKDQTFLDFNMSGMPLIEIVTKPVFFNIDDAILFCKKVQKIVRNLDLGEVDMEKGQMRLEPNISLRTEEMENKNILPQYKVEIKNINSFRFMEKAVLAEIKRQRTLLDAGEMPIQENRGYDEISSQTVSQRKKEEAHDYRYFPEPDIPPMFFDKNYIADITKEYEKRLNNSADAVKEKFLKSYNLETRITAILIDDPNITIDHLKLAGKLTEEGYEFRDIANKLINKPEVRDLDLIAFKNLLNQQSVRVTDEAVLGKVIKEVIDKNMDAVQSYKSGKENAFQFLVGMIMKETKGQADAHSVRFILESKLKDL